MATGGQSVDSGQVKHDIGDIYLPCVHPLLVRLLTRSQQQSGLRNVVMFHNLDHAANV